MKKSFDQTVEFGRVRQGAFATCPGDRYGAFFLRGPRGEVLKVIASDGSEWGISGMPQPAWEHVSISNELRCPTWDEMCFAKSLFWDDEECVIQFHPPKSEHVNFHEFCLHLWKPVGIQIPRPPAVAVGPTSRGGGQ